MTINKKFRWTFHLDTKEDEVQLGDSSVFVKSVELPVVSSNLVLGPPHKKFTSLKVVYYDAKDNRDFKKLIVSKLGYVKFKGTLVYYDRSGDETDKIIFDLGSATIKFSDLNYLDSEECTISIEFEVKGMNFDEIKSKELSKDIKNDVDYIKYQKSSPKSYSSKIEPYQPKEFPASQWQPHTDGTTRGFYGEVVPAVGLMASHDFFRQWHGAPTSKSS